MPNTRYSFGVSGPSCFIRAVAEVQAELMDPYLDSDGWQYDPDYFQRVPALNRRQKIVALGGMEIIGVLVGFVGVYFGTKLLDELYERTIKRPIGKQLDKLFRALDAPADTCIEYRDVIYFEDLDLAVVIRAIVSKDLAHTLQSQLVQAHRLAHLYIADHGRKAPVHCYKIVDGQVTLEPEFFSSLEEIRRHDQAELGTTVRR